MNLFLLNAWHLRFHDNPKEYGGSEAQYKAGMLVTAVKQDFKLRYNEDLRENLDTFDMMSIYDDYFFKDAKDVFIGGMLTPHKQGTCSSMPVLLIAVGRRLGYPLYLVASKGHLFCRWDDGKGNRFNFDGTGEGFSVADDEYYMNFPRPISKEELKNTHYMQSMTPRQELVTFLHIRRACLQFNKRDTEALMCAARCLDLEPKDRMNYIALASEGVLPPSVKNMLSRSRTKDYLKKDEEKSDEQKIDDFHENHQKNEERKRRESNPFPGRIHPNHPFKQPDTP